MAWLRWRGVDRLSSFCGHAWPPDPCGRHWSAHMYPAVTPARSAVHAACRLVLSSGGRDQRGGVGRAPVAWCGPLESHGYPSLASGPAGGALECSHVPRANVTKLDRP